LQQQQQHPTAADPLLDTNTVSSSSSQHLQHRQQLADANALPSTRIQSYATIQPQQQQQQQQQQQHSEAEALPGHIDSSTVEAPQHHTTVDPLHGNKSHSSCSPGQQQHPTAADPLLDTNTVSSSSSQHLQHRQQLADANALPSTRIQSYATSQQQQQQQHNEADALPGHIDSSTVGAPQHHTTVDLLHGSKSHSICSHDQQQQQQQPVAFVSSAAQARIGGLLSALSVYFAADCKAELQQALQSARLAPGLPDSVATRQCMVCSESLDQANVLAYRLVSWLVAQQLRWTSHLSRSSEHARVLSRQGAVGDAHMHALLCWRLRCHPRWQSEDYKGFRHGRAVAVASTLKILSQPG
jgi:hypothetical protein